MKFAKKLSEQLDGCPTCGDLALAEYSGVFHFEVPPNVKGGPIDVVGATWEQCANCGEAILGNAVTNAIEIAIKMRKGN